MVEMAVYDFLANLKGGGARPNLYRVVLPFPVFAIATGEESKTLGFLCKAASLPASTMGVISPNFRGRKVHIPGDRTFEDGWKITILNDTDFQIRNAFERWSNEMNQHRANHGAENPQSIMSSAKIEQLNHQGDIIKTYEMVGVWPSDVASIGMGYDRENSIEEFDVTLQFQFWESDTTT